MASKKYATQHPKFTKNFKSLWIYTRPMRVDEISKWRKYGKNPILDLGSLGEWDDTNVHEPCVYKEKKAYFMLYYGRHGEIQQKEGAIGLATSPDGINWQKHRNNPVLKPSGEFDRNGVLSPIVIKENGYYYLFFTMIDSSGEWSVGLACSKDLINYTKMNGGRPVLKSSASGWDSKNILHPYVFKEGNLYYMFYTGVDASEDPFHWRIGLAVSTDKIKWKKTGKPVLDIGKKGEWDCAHAGEPCVIKIKNQYVMFYEGSDGNSRIGYAVSTNLKDWSKSKKPVLDLSETPKIVRHARWKFRSLFPTNLGSRIRPLGSWDDTHTSAAHILVDISNGLIPLLREGEMTMYYSGEDPAARIGCAYCKLGE